MGRTRSAFLFQGGNQERSLAGEIKSPLQVAIRQRPHRLGQERPRVFNHPTIFGRRDLAFELGDALAKPLLEGLGLLAQGDLLAGRFPRLERRNLSRGRLFGFGSRIGGGRSLCSWQRAAARRRLGGGGFRRGGLHSFGRRRFLDDDRTARLACGTRSRRGRSGRVNDMSSCLPLRASPDKHRQAEKGIKGLASHGRFDCNTP